jgi:hypothetical protein
MPVIKRAFHSSVWRLFNTFFATVNIWRITLEMFSQMPAGFLSGLRIKYLLFLSYQNQN